VTTVEATATADEVRGRTEEGEQFTFADTRDNEGAAAQPFR
jgi:hypothetical protein